METLDYSFVDKDEARRLFKLLKGVYEGNQVQEYICGSWVDVKLGYDVLGVFDNFRIKPEDDKHKETKDMEQKTEINIDEVNKEMTDYIKKEAEKCKTPPAGIKTIPKRRIYYKDILDKLYETYKAKDQDYGSAFSEMFDELGIDYAYGKLREKMNRIKVLRNKPNMVENEGLEDALIDMAGYAILTLVELKKRKSNGKSE